MRSVWLCMKNLPPQVSALLQVLSNTLPSLLGNNLVGLYLYGSLTQGAFNQDRSDVDCIAVTLRELPEHQFVELAAWLTRFAAENSWVARLQISFMIRDEILINTPKGNCLYQFGKLSRVGSDGNPIIWMNVMESGVVLYGPPPETFVPTITSEILYAALIREVGYLREEIFQATTGEWRDVLRYRSYAVLTLCRILYSYAYGTIVSKPLAAKWALRILPAEWHAIITNALEADSGISGIVIDIDGIERLIEFTEASLNA